jgi:Carboxypeptidase regulatory-like domain
MLRFNMRCLALLLGLAVLTCSSARLLFAQDYRARLTALATDQSGKAIPNAKLELRRLSTGAVQTASTDETGVYIFQFLEPDTYSLTAEAPGFAKAQVNGIVLQSYQATSVTALLKVASEVTNITVTDEAPLLGTESASRTFTLSTDEVHNLPVPNNNPVMIANTQPAVYLRPLGAFTDPWTVTSQFQINGGLAYLNEFQVDGSPNDVQLGVNAYGYTPPNYAVKEVSVSANNYDAEYGHTSGGVINISTKSGTDTLHGEGWVFLKRPGWNANSYQNKAIGAPRPVNSQNQYGFQVGGPLLIPHLLEKSNRVKAFYFAAFDRYTEKLPNPLTVSFPEPEMINGDFSHLTDAQGNLITIYDPATAHTDSSGNIVRDPFPGNIIPQNRTNPVAAAVAALMPKQNHVSPGQRYGQNDFVVPSNFYNWSYYNWLGRVDFNIGSKYQIFLRPFTNYWQELSTFNGLLGPGRAGGQYSRTNWGGLVDFVDVLSDKTLLNVRYSDAIYRNLWTAPGNQGFNLASLALPASFISLLDKPPLFGQWSFEQYASMGWFNEEDDTHTRAVEGSISHVVGKHNLRAGVDIRYIKFPVFTPGTFDFNSQADWTRAIYNDPSSEAYSGDSFASFLLGTPSSGFVQKNSTWDLHTWYIAPWFQDDWKLNRRLTVNLGLRYDFLTPPVENKDRMNIGFDAYAPSAIYAPQLGQLTGAIKFARVNGNSRSPLDWDLNTIQPRAGFSFLVTPRMVVRGGYGLFIANYQSNDMFQNIGFSSTTNIVNSLDGGITPVQNLLNNPLSNGVIPAPGASLGSLAAVGNGFTTFNRSYKVPRANEFSLGVQYSIGQHGVLDVAYVGQRTTHVSEFCQQNQPCPMQYNANLPSWSFTQQCDEMYSSGKASICDALVTNPLQGVNGLRGTNLYSASTITAFQLHRPSPQFLDINYEGLSNGKLWYNALQTSFTERLYHGLTMGTSFVWSKQIEQWGYLNQYTGVVQRSPYNLSLPFVFKVYANYELPIGKGKLLNLGTSRVLNTLFGGWQFSPDFMATSGEPAYLPRNAIMLRNSFVKHANWKSYQVRGWGNCVLVKDINGNTAPAPYSSGCTTFDWEEVPVLPGESANPFTSGQLRMEPIITSNAALTKTFKLERLELEFRAQATNVLNHYNLLTARFNTNPNDPNFGTLFPTQASSLDVPPRVLQLGIRGRF